LAGFFLTLEADDRGFDPLLLLEDGLTGRERGFEGLDVFLRGGLLGEDEAARGEQQSDLS
jgi:hypothetical protein